MIWLGLLGIVSALILWRYPGTHRSQLAAVLVAGCVGGGLVGQGYGRWFALDHASTTVLMREIAERMVRDVAPEACNPLQEQGTSPDCESRKKLIASLNRANSLRDLVDVIEKAMASARSSMSERGR